MKKILISSAFILSFAFSVLYERGIDIRSLYLKEDKGIITQGMTIPVSTNDTSSSTPGDTVAVIGRYRDGTYLGNLVDETYGKIQLQVVIRNGNIATITYPVYPNEIPRSLEISKRALPILIQEAITVQSENIDAVTGASYLSPAFIQSLKSALDQARV